MIPRATEDTPPLGVSRRSSTKARVCAEFRERLVEGWHQRILTQRIVEADVADVAEQFLRKQSLARRATDGRETQLPGAAAMRDR